jgi:hypothetical protein
MKKSIVTAIAATAMVTIFLSGISSAGSKMSYSPSYKSSGLTKKFNRPTPGPHVPRVIVPIYPQPHNKRSSRLTRVPNVPQPLQLTLAGAIAKCNNKYPGMGVNKAVLKNGKWLCINGDIVVGSL